MPTRCAKNSGATRSRACPVAEAERLIALVAEFEHLPSTNELTGILARPSQRA